MSCEYNDCGWCYAPSDEDTNARAGACALPDTCPSNTGLVHVPIVWPDLNLPPINLDVLPSAYNFYSSDTYVPTEGCDTEEHY